jgi:predicted dehydrogenase
MQGHRPVPIVGDMTGGADREPVRVGFIGAGSVLWAYLQLVDRLAPRGIATAGPIAARRRDRREQILDRRPGAELVATAEEVVGSDVEVVAILTPAHSHAELARLALEHGKHVLVEKPLALTRQEGEELASIAHEGGRHLVAAPFVHLAPTFRALWAEIADGAIGRVHTARGLYGVPTPDWNEWMVEVGPLVDLGLYNLKSLTSLLGSVTEVVAANSQGVAARRDDAAPAATQLIVRHEGGALSSLVSSWSVHAYHRPALELYGTDGTANLLGDDWDPRGYEIYRPADRSWREFDPIDPTWLWTDGLREFVMAVREDRPLLANIEQDLHLLEVVEAARLAASSGQVVPVASRFEAIDLRLPAPEAASGHIHDHTRSPEEQR